MNLLRNNHFPPERLPSAGLGANAGVKQQVGSSTQTKFLIVTNFPDQFATLSVEAIVVRTCKDARYELQKSLYTAIFCDLGPLGPDENGLKFAFSLRLQGMQTPLFLMSETVTLEDETHAMHQGAKGLITRNAESLTGALNQHGRAITTPFRLVDQNFMSTGQQRPLIPLESLDRIKGQLRKYIGPFADDLVFKTLASIGKRYPNGVPYHALVHAVANYVEVPKERDRFLTDLGV